MTKTTAASQSSRPSVVNSCIFVFGVPAWIFVMVNTAVVWSNQMLTLDKTPDTGFRHHIRSGPHSELPSHLMDETNVPIPKHSDGSPMSVGERLRYLELKVMSNLNFGTIDPWIGSAVHKEACKNSTKLKPFGCQPGWEAVDKRLLEKHPTTACLGLFDQAVCLDDLPKPRDWDFEMNQPVGSTAKAKSIQKSDKMASKMPCLVYDFGIRAQPQFGAVLARTFGCEVHAFDPSPVSKRYMSDSGVDGKVDLFDYDWGQVSNIRFPSLLRDCSNATADDKECDFKRVSSVQKTYQLPVKTFNTIRRELGHEERVIDVMKLDVEGSEFAFLEQMLDSNGGCPDFIRQITLEWHHFGFDSRYGEGSSAPINAISTLLKSCGFELFDIHSRGGWVSRGHMYEEMQMHDVRYNIAAFRRTRKPPQNKPNKKVML